MSREPREGPGKKARDPEEGGRAPGALGPPLPRCAKFYYAERSHGAALTVPKLANMCSAAFMIAMTAAFIAILRACAFIPLQASTFERRFNIRSEAANFDTVGSIGTQQKQLEETFPRELLDRRVYLHSGYMKTARRVKEGHIRKGTTGADARKRRRRSSR